MRKLEEKQKCVEEDLEVVKETEPNEEKKQQKESKRKKRQTRIIVTFLIIVMAIIIGVFFIMVTMKYRKPMSKGFAKGLDWFTEWLQDNKIVGFMLYTLIFTLGTLWFAPIWLLIVGGTFAFTRAYGFYEGIALIFLWSYIALHLGAFLALFFGSKLWRGWKGKLQSKVKYIDVFNFLAKSRGIKITFLLRLAVIFPITLVNFIMAFTEIKIWEYFIGNHAMLPEIWINIYIGWSMKDFYDNMESGKQKGSTLKLVSAITGLVWVIIAITYISYVAKTEYKQMLKGRKETEIVENPENSKSVASGVDEVVI